ncbi:MAG TPA: class I SAM-dependent methyltransferase [Candidatus Omnitrophota bacterium]|nr:class I SAM-dependent methyltransferase [Candidatus Omnitrophota bacterium]
MKDKDNHSGPEGTHQSHAGSHDVFDNVEMFIEKFDGAERDEWQKPDEVIKSFNLPDDAVVVEVGAGTGYFAVRLAPQVKNGKVICYDQSAKMISYLGNRVSELGLTNVDARSTGPDGGLELEEKANLIFSVDVYHHLNDRVAYFSKIAQYLKPGGALVVIDRTEEKVEGQPTGHRVPKEKIIEEMKEAGFELATDFDFLLPVQYYLAFKRAA